MQQPFNFSRWIDRHIHLLKPPVANRHLFDTETDMVVMVIGGPNARTDYHDDPVGEFFYQLRGTMLLKVIDNEQFIDVPITEGEVFYLPPHVRHSPQRPQAGSVGLVVEGNRDLSARDGFEWYCFECGALVHRVELVVEDIVKDLPPLFEAFYDDVAQRKCKSCGALHPGREVPADWVNLSR